MARELVEWCSRIKVGSVIALAGADPGGDEEALERPLRFTIATPAAEVSGVAAQKEGSQAPQTDRRDLLTVERRPLGRSRSQAHRGQV